MTTLRNLFFASLLASALLVPAVGADVGRAVNGRPPQLLVRDFVTAHLVSSESPETVLSATLPRLVADLAGWARQAGRR